MKLNTEEVKQELRRLRTKQELMMKQIEKLEEHVDNLESAETQVEVSMSADKLDDAKRKKEVVLSAAKQAKQKLDLEQRIGGTWLNWIGVIAVVFGLAYFLKYSFDNQWIGPTGRISLGVLLGITMMGAGEVLRNRYAGYAQGLLGGGSLALFFSIFASYQFYQLIPAAYAFIFLILVMVVTVFMAIRHHSLPIGILGIIGGYVTPFLIGSSDPSLWSLFSYLALLSAGVLVVSIFKKWPVFQYLSFVFNQLIFLFSWVMATWSSGLNEDFFPLFAFLVYNFIMYLGVATVYNIFKKKQATKWDVGLIVLNAFSFFALSLLLLDETFLRDYLGFYAVFLAFIYIYCGRLAYQLYDDKVQVYSLFLVSFVMITLAVPLQLSGTYLTLAWLAEAVGLAYMAKQLHVQRMFDSALLVLILGLISATEEIGNLYATTYSTFLFNNPTLLLVASVLTVVGVMKLAQDVKLFKTNIGVNHVLTIVLLLLVFVGVTLENSHFFQLQQTEYFLSPEQLSLSALWLLYASSLFVLGIRRKKRYFRYGALGLMAIVIVKAFFVDLANLAPVFKIILFIVLGFFLLGISYVYQRKKKETETEEEL